MTSTPPNRAVTSHLPPGLFTRAEVLAALRRERGERGLTKTAELYGIAPSQICDVLSCPPRKRLSKKMIEALRFRLIELYEKVGE